MFIVASVMYTTNNMCITTNYKRQMGDENHFWSEGVYFLFECCLLEMMGCIFHFHIRLLMDNDDQHNMALFI